MKDACDKIDARMSEMDFIQIFPVIKLPLESDVSFTRHLRESAFLVIHRQEAINYHIGECGIWSIFFSFFPPWQLNFN